VVFVCVKESKPFEVSLKVNDIELNFVASPVDESGTEIVYELLPAELLAPPVDSGDGKRLESLQEDRCEKCDSQGSYCLVKDTLHSRCRDHSAGGIFIDFAPLCLLKPPTLKDLLVRLVSAEVTENQKVHKLAKTLRDDGFSWKEASHQLESMGFSGVAVRTLQKHVAGECSCFAGERKFDS
jgi:hypothetical protein